MTIELLLVNVVAGMSGAIVLSLTSYAKARTEDGKLETFNNKKFATTAILGGIIGGMSTYRIELSPEMIASISASITFAIENISKAIRRLPYFNK